jgi:anaerobic magnesium-protoporphyrin IX monomethyl ester cyclase
MPKKRVMLIFPPFSQPASSKKRCLVPLGIAYIGAYLRDNGINVRILDCVVEGYDNNNIQNGINTFGLSWEDIEKEIKLFKPQFVGVSCLMTSQRHNAVKVCQIAKKINKKIHTFMGGCHPSAMPDEVLSHKEVDSVIIGEGELASLKIINYGLYGKIQEKALEIDSIPWPARDLLPIEKYIKINMPENIFSPYNRITQLITSRGCPFQCKFCAVRNFHGGWRGRNSEDVVNEIKFLKDTYQVEEVNIIDENFILDKQRAIEILKGISSIGISWSNPGGIWTQGLDEELLGYMKKANAYQLTLPVESSNEHILKDVIKKPLDINKLTRIMKECRRLKIDTHAFFICGFPEQTKEDMINDYKYAKKVKFDSASFHILTPLPGSDLYPIYKNYIDLDNINYIHATIPHPTMKKEEIESLVHEFNVKFNKSLRYRHPIKYFKKYILLPYRKKFNNPLQRV